ncbi:MAG: SET domain-containing protein-lysine N-methyltransferase [Polyangiaceae bacterium]
MSPVTKKPRKPAVVRKRPVRPFFKVKTSRIEGRGAFAARLIRKGTRIIEYVGERITSAEADARYDDANNLPHHTFLFALDNGTAIDAAYDGNDARFLNHACEPNCEAVMEGDRIFIESIKTIRVGEELVYDYRYMVDADFDEADLLAMYPCRCGRATCRGTIAIRQKKRAPRRRVAAKKRVLR